MQWPLLWEDPTCLVLILCRGGFSRKEITSAQLASTWGQALCCLFLQTLYPPLTVREVKPVRVVLIVLPGTGKSEENFKKEVRCYTSVQHPKIPPIT